MKTIVGNIPFLILCLYILALFVISTYASRLARGGTTSFLLAGRKLTTPLIAVNVAALAVGAASTVGVAESSFNTGLSAGWYNAAWAGGAMAMGLFGAAQYRRLNISSLPELFDRAFGKSSRFISAIALLIVLMMITSLQYLAGGAILSVMLPDYFSFQSGMLVSAVVFIGIALIGGLWSSGLSNILSVFLIYFGLIISTIIATMRMGGLTALESKLPAGTPWLSPLGTLPLGILLGWFVVMISQALSAQGTVQIACSAKDEKSARNGFIWGAILIFPIGFFCAVLGMVARVQFPDALATQALPLIVLSLPAVVAGIVLSALWAADVSTACTILMGASTLFTHDIFKRFIKPDSEERHLMLVSRLSIVVIGLITLILAFQASDIVKTMMIGLSLTTAFTLVFLMLIFKPQWCRKGSAFWTVLVGIIILAAWVKFPQISEWMKTNFPFFSHVIYLEWLFCTLTFFIVYFVDKRPIGSIKPE